MHISINCANLYARSSASKTLGSSKNVALPWLNSITVETCRYSASKVLQNEDRPYMHRTSLLNKAPDVGILRRLSLH